MVRISGRLRAMFHYALTCFGDVFGITISTSMTITQDVGKIIPSSRASVICTIFQGGLRGVLLNTIIIVMFSSTYFGKKRTEKVRTRGRVLQGVYRLFSFRNFKNLRVNRSI